MKNRNKPAISRVTIDKSLDCFEGKNLFPDQLKRANEFIAKHGLPREYYISQGITPPRLQLLNISRCKASGDFIFMISNFPWACLWMFNIQSGVTI
ncbi:hypothetical protein [Dyadobacter sp. 676]|uniref:Uncharacterized protein n=1 Tax=Dyadobacter sp. 676 TaxID=3088362 RepID=A0AAU8FJM8_9BACT